MAAFLAGLRYMQRPYRYLQSRSISSEALHIIRVSKYLQCLRISPESLDISRVSGYLRVWISTETEFLHHYMPCSDGENDMINVSVCLFFVSVEYALKDALK